MHLRRVCIINWQYVHTSRAGYRHIPHTLPQPIASRAFVHTMMKKFLKQLTNYFSLIAHGWKRMSPQLFHRAPATSVSVVYVWLPPTLRSSRPCSSFPLLQWRPSTLLRVKSSMKAGSKLDESYSRHQTPSILRTYRVLPQ